VNQSIMELLIMIDAFKRRVGRADHRGRPVLRLRPVRQEGPAARPDHRPPDRRHDHGRRRDRVLTMDLHQGQIQGFFNIPVDELTAVHMLSNYFLHKHLETLVVVTTSGSRSAPGPSPRPRRAARGHREARIGNLDRAELMNVIGDVRGRRAIIVDDEIDTAGTLIEIVRALEREGVTEIYACATHGVLSDPAIDRIRESRCARSS
jgi:ribose-phosphate pyrophosphokinase